MQNHRQFARQRCGKPAQKYTVFSKVFIILMQKDGNTDPCLTDSGCCIHTATNNILTPQFPSKGTIYETKIQVER